MITPTKLLHGSSGNNAYSAATTYNGTDTTTYADGSVVEFGGAYYRNETGADIVIDNTDPTTLPTGAGSTWTAYAAGHPACQAMQIPNGVPQ